MNYPASQLREITMLIYLGLMATLWAQEALALNPHSPIAQ